MITVIPADTVEVGNTLVISRNMTIKDRTITLDMQTEVLHQRGSLGDNFNASLQDGLSAKCWPISGYTYFIIRTKNHLGDCERRKTAMRFSYYFYTSESVEATAAKLRFARYGLKREYAQAEYKKNNIKISSMSDVSKTVSKYLSSYYSIDSQTKWNLTTDDSSCNIWSRFIQAPESFAGAFIMFMSQIENWNHTRIRMANWENRNFLPDQQIKVVAVANSPNVNQIFTLYLASQSPEFKESQNIESLTGNELTALGI
eukprot:gene11952-25038_t